VLVRNPIRGQECEVPVLGLLKVELLEDHKKNMTDEKERRIYLSPSVTPMIGWRPHLQIDNEFTGGE
jgi:hypothetical protein